MKNLKDLRSFLILWSSQTVSQLGTAMTDYALIIWVYGRKGTASSITLLTLCAFMPTIFFRFIAGAFADRMDKKKIMLTADTIAACGTLLVLILHSSSMLEVWHIYVINLLLSFMNAFQEPASFVATSLLVPKEHYSRASGLQGVSGSVIAILAPALGSILLAFGGMNAVLILDLISFGIAFAVLLFFIKIPRIEGTEDQDGSILKSSMDGLRYLREHTALLYLTIFIAAVNFFAKLGNDGMISPFVLARTGGDQRILGIVKSATALGLLAGSILMTVMKPAKKKARLVFLTTAMVFSANIFEGLFFSPVIWCIAEFVSYAIAVIMNVNLTTIMREKVPIEMQGRVFSAQDTLKNCTIPLGLFLGGILADHVFEPFMRTSSPLQNALSVLFGAESGSGIALIFFLVGIAGITISIAGLRKSVCEELDG